MEIYNGLRSEMKTSKGCSLSSKEEKEEERRGEERRGEERRGGEGKGGKKRERKGKRKGNDYFKCNVMPAGPEDFQMLLLCPLFQLTLTFPSWNNSSSFLSTLKS